MFRSHGGARLLACWTAAGMALGVLASVGTASGSTQAMASQPAGIGLYTGLQGGTAPNASQLQAIGQSSALVVATPAGMASYQAALKKANPAITLLVYENGMFSVPTDPSGMPESWFMHSSSGVRVHPANNPQNSLMNPLSTAAFTAGGVTYHGWTDYVAKECIADQTSMTSGCFLDASGPAPLGPKYDYQGIVPVNPVNGAAFTYASYMSLTSANAANVHGQTGTITVANGFVSGNGYYKKSTNMIDQTGTVAGEAERWMYAGSWQQNVQMLIDNARIGTGAMLNYVASSTNLETQREYVTASFLIGRGPHQFLQFSDTSHQSFQQLSPLYSMPIGQPLSTLSSLSGYLQGGVYRRDYTNGTAIANPGSSTVTVTLGGTYKDVNGNSMTSVKLAPQTGIVLVRG